MNSAINPEAEQPTVRLSYEQSDRNPPVADWAGNGGFLPAPAGSETRTTQAGLAPSQDAGLSNYDDQGSSSQVEDEAERES